MNLTSDKFDSITQVSALKTICWWTASFDLAYRIFLFYYARFLLNVFFFYFINLSTSVLISNPEELKEQIYFLYTSRREICFWRLEITWVFFSEILTYLHIYCKCFSNVLGCGVLKDACIKLIFFFTCYPILLHDQVQHNNGIPLIYS